MRVSVSVSRLLKLADFLDKLPRDRFAFGIWWESDPVGIKSFVKKVPSCGTVGCALGWACSMPEFKRLGLYLQEICEYVAVPALVVVDESDALGIDAAVLLFGISYDEAGLLFFPRDKYRVMDTLNLPDTATPKQVARNIRKFCKKKWPAEMEKRA